MACRKETSTRAPHGAVDAANDAHDHSHGQGEGGHEEIVERICVRGSVHAHAHTCQLGAQGCKPCASVRALASRTLAHIRSCTYSIQIA